MAQNCDILILSTQKILNGDTELIGVVNNLIRFGSLNELDQWAFICFQKIIGHLMLMKVVI